MIIQTYTNIDDSEQGKKIAVAIDVNTGKELWRKEYKAIKYEELYMKKIKDLGTYSGFHGDTFLFSNFINDKESGLIALDVNTGEERWRMIGFQTFEMQNLAYNGDMVFLDGVAYATPDYVEKPPSESTPPIVVKYQVGDKAYQIGDKTFDMDVSPAIINNKTYLPAKYLVEPLGGVVEYTDNVKKVTCKLAYPGWMDSHDMYKENILEMYVGKPKATLNGKEVQIDPNNPKITPIIKNGRTMVPVRFLAESLGCEVKWVAESKTILVTYKP